jgi:hypothetical protein
MAVLAGLAPIAQVTARAHAADPAAGRVSALASRAAPPDTGAAAYVPLAPARAADSRTGQGIVRIDAHRWRVGLAEHLGDEATAVVISLTLLGHSGFAVATAAGAPAPGSSQVNLSSGGVASATAVVAVNGDRAIDVHTGGAGVEHVIVDVVGEFVPAVSARAGRLVAIDPQRVLDTRVAGAPAARAASVRIPAPPGVPPDAVAIAVNLTVVPHEPAGFVSAMPAGAPVPPISLLNATGTGVIRAVTAIVPMSPEGIDVYTGFTTELVVDVAGYFTGPSAQARADGLFVALPEPARRVDTRREPGGMLGPGATREIAIGPQGATFFGTVTMVDTADGGFVTAHAAGEPRPLASTANANGALETVSNAAIVGASERGIAVSSSHGTHLVVDQYGWFTGTRRAATLPEAPATPYVPEYPVGPCDTVVPGLPPLTPAAAPRTVVRIGTSRLGRPILAEYHGPPEPARVVLVVGQVHGNECAPLLFVDEVRRAEWRSVGVWLIPTLNPDGHAAGTRGNAAAVDLNKDGGAMREPETAALMRFTRRIAPSFTVHVHSPNGQVAWFGTDGYVPNAPHRSGARVSGPLAERVAIATGLVLTGAGQRSIPGTWFLWQGQRQVLPTHEALLVELYAVADREVPFARPRPPTASVDSVRQHCRTIVDLIEGSMG